MQTFLFILIVLAAIGALVSIVRGVYYFLQSQHEELRTGEPSANGLKQNRMMWRRVQFQAIAIVFVILFLLVARGHAG
ncbi:HIG1 domain-containing protein [Sphingomonas sp. BIUV-7]|uniref:HIG1 domain-containing protein n=1 Tax=Sphingomonas natans TaxID=3063330 RepID=A0ABT8YDY9_9SPHN|nr:HIG1 domain-containing protein [Sphingomonas sp. BIUV-7]MDO6416568.1 HIG1 domain-containing protein [Sphingomonas sp. BIUV-7]